MSPPESTEQPKPVPARRGWNAAFIHRKLTNIVGRSGQLNAKQRELAELQAMAQRRLKGARQNFAEGMEAARETRRDVDYIKSKTA